MKREDAASLVETALDELSKQLAKGKTSQLRSYLKAVSCFHNYSFTNCMLIMRQRPRATRVAGFRAWQKLNRFVKKGEKGICILAPLAKKNDDGESVIYGFRAVHVFDISQTDVALPADGAGAVARVALWGYQKSDRPPGFHSIPGRQR